MIGTGAGEGNRLVPHRAVLQLLQPLSNPGTSAVRFTSLSPRESVRQLYYRLTEIAGRR